MQLPKVVIVGAGPAGLMAAYLLKDAAEITLIDQKKAPGRKFLVAGDGGLNLTHSEELPLFLSRYNSAIPKKWVGDFSPADLVRWFSELGISTYTGSSGKIFPDRKFKPVEVLNAILGALDSPGVNWKLGERFEGFDNQRVFIGSDAAGIEYDFLVLALGGASWKKTGSDGKWTAFLHEKGLQIRDFEASNAGIELPDEDFCRTFEGSLIKNAVVRTQKVATAGDIRITRYGLEGKPVYAANHAVREGSEIWIDFKPQLGEGDIAAKLSAGNVRHAFRELRLPDAAYNWLKRSVTKSTFTSPDELAALIKSFPVVYSRLRPVEEAISTVGGLSMTEIEPSGELKKFNNVYCAGEMLDWDAPTGGYLLQACFASGHTVGQAVLERIRAIDRSSGDSPFL